MGIFKREIIFPEVEAKLFEGGTPITDQRIIRSWNLDRSEEQFFDETRTDSEGHFSFPEVSVPMKLRGILSEFRVSQLMYLANDYDNLETDIDPDTFFWSCTKWDSSHYFEFDGSPAKLVCDLTAEEHSIRKPTLKLTTRCTIVPK